MGRSPSELERRLRAAERLDEMADTAELMGDDAGARRFRDEAAGSRMVAMHLLDE
jgi:hypothetical protein